jgi:uncharacterized protein (DUF433 family)
MSTIPVIAEHIVITPGVCGGKPRIAGHRVTVQDIAFRSERLGLTPVEIVTAIPTITLADVHAALAYYHDHREELDASMDADDELFEELRRSQPSIIEKLEGRHARIDPLPPR